MATVSDSIESMASADLDTRHRAASQLGESADVAALEPLLLALDDPAWNIRAAAATGIGKLYYQSAAVRAHGSARLVDALLPLLKAAEPGLRINAVRSLGWIHDPRAADPVRGLLSDSDGSVREAAITALGMLGDKASSANLIALLKHEDKWVRHKAANALGNLHAPEAFEPLVTALSDPERVVRGAAIRALQELGDPRGAAPIRALLRDSDPDVRFWAIGAAVAFKDSEALPHLRTMSANDTGYGNGQHLNKVAREALGKISGKSPLCDLFRIVGTLIERVAPKRKIRTDK